MDFLSTAVLLIGYVATLAGVFTGLWKFWKKLKAIADGQQCQLRNDITNIFYNYIYSTN